MYSTLTDYYSNDIKNVIKLIDISFLSLPSIDIFQQLTKCYTAIYFKLRYFYRVVKFKLVSIIDNRWRYMNFVKFKCKISINRNPIL